MAAGPEKVLDALGALMTAEPEVGDGFLLAAIYCQAIRSDDSPRNVVEALWKSVPDSKDWPPLRVALLAMLDD